MCWRSRGGQVVETVGVASMTYCSSSWRPRRVALVTPFTRRIVVRQGGQQVQPTGACEHHRNRPSIHGTGLAAALVYKNTLGGRTVARPRATAFWLLLLVWSRLSNIRSNHGCTATWTRFCTRLSLFLMQPSRTWKVPSGNGVLCLISCGAYILRTWCTRVNGA